MLEASRSLPLGGTRRNAFVRSKEGNVPRVLRVPSTKGRAIAAMLVLAAVSMEPASAYTTTFSRRPMAGWHDTPAATRWVARDGAVRRTYVPRGYGELVRRTAFGLHDDFFVAAVIRTSPGRTNAGLTTLFRDHANHMWGKIEISPGHPRGFMSIGHRIRGRTVSLLARSAVRLKRGTPYRVRLAKHQMHLRLTVSTRSGALLGSIVHTLTSRERRALAGASKAGLRSKTLWDEDDGRSRWRWFAVFHA